MPHRRRRTDRSLVCATWRQCALPSQAWFRLGLLASLPPSPNWFSRFAGLTVVTKTQHADTLRPRHSVCSSRPHLSCAMRPNNEKNGRSLHISSKPSYSKIKGGRFLVHGVSECIHVHLARFLYFACTWPMNASGNWVDLFQSVQISLVRFSSCAVNNQ